MKKSFKKFVVFTMVCMLALTPMTAFADDSTTAPATGNASGSGEIEGVVDKDVFCVSLPTTSDATDIFDFTLDPQSLIAETEGEAYDEDITFEEDATLFFNTAVSGNSVSSNSATTYASESASLIIKNKSTFDVDVDVTAKLTGLSDANKTYTIVPKTDENYTNDTTTSMYLALNLGGTDKAITAEGITASSTIEKVADGSYEVVYDNGYTYELKEDVTEFPTSMISLKGSCNSNAEVDWMPAKDAAPSVELTWSVDKHMDGPQVTISTTGLITITGLTAAQNTDFLTWTTKGTANNTTPTSLDANQVTFGTENWTKENGGTLLCQLGSGYVVYYGGDTMILTIGLSDGTTVSGSVTFPAAN